MKKKFNIKPSKAYFIHFERKNSLRTKKCHKTHKCKEVISFIRLYMDLIRHLPKDAMRMIAILYSLERA